MKIRCDIIRNIAEQNNIDITSLDKKVYDAINGNFVEQTFKQAEKLAKKLQVSFGTLFLDTYQKAPIPIPDFRGNKNGISNALTNSIKNSILKQSLLRDYLISVGAEQFDCKASNDKEIIDFIKKITEFDKNSNKEKVEARKGITLALEKFNINVMQSGIGDNNHTRDKINISEARGYAIYDSYSPFIFINSNDKGKGAIFTLLHELAHICIKSSGISSYDINMDIERRCNNIAGEILMPNENFIWNNGISMGENIDNLSKEFRLASELAIATKALLLKKIKYDSYESYRDSLFKKFDIERREKKSKGGNYYDNTIVRNGKLFTKVILTQTLNSHETYRNAMHFLEIKKLSAFDKLAERCGI